MDEVLPTLDYIAGLIAGAGSFMTIKQNGRLVHVFQLKMHAAEKPLFEAAKKRLGLDETVHEYNHQNRHYVLLIVRDRQSILRKVIPALDERLFGTKKVEYVAWRESFYTSIMNSKYKKYLIELL